MLMRSLLELHQLFQLYVAGEVYRNLTTFWRIILTVSLTFQTLADFTVVSRPKSDKNLFLVLVLNCE